MYICQRFIVRSVLFLILWFNGWVKCANNRIIRLGNYRADRGVTLSGFSSGASFAHTLHIAHSSLFSGVGIFAGLYYEYREKTEEPVKGLDLPGNGIDASVRAIQKYQREGLIDKTRYLRYQKVFLWAGIKDEYHNITERLAMVQIYEPLLRSPLQLYTKAQLAHHRYPIGHCHPGVETNGYEGHCHFDGKREMFSFFFGRAPLVFNKGPFNELEEFDQSEFFAGIPGEIGMSDIGLQYIPRTCLKNGRACHVHFFFHGCLQESVEMHKKRILEMDFFGIAEGSRIIFIFPLTPATPTPLMGCWDFLGLTGPKYATKEGNQIRVLRRMIKRLTGR